ncbi:hypothetical protein SKAU_G00323790 [Synaphobranchus kaupii]|uniref:Uncharacterized protein n=1 Tax=Synaphobranchus kaupii TaxID=118154 RepID=A0A9Q1IK18_SYNKA|nr:hypothetical protein SKAU_G00323790 [Synaphobranchus kaupii]
MESLARVPRIGRGDLQPPVTHVPPAPGPRLGGAAAGHAHPPAALVIPRSAVAGPRVRSVEAGSGQSRPLPPPSP